MTIPAWLVYSPRMSLVRALGLASLFLLCLAGCREEAACVERNVAGRMEVVVECSTGKVAVCGTEGAEVYDPMTGALLPVPSEELSADGSCPDGVGDCRPRPTCAGDDQPVMCANGETAYCVLGNVDEIDPPMMIPDAGPPMDAGTIDAGAGDAGEGTDGGDTDGGGDTDAGDSDGG